MVIVVEGKKDASKIKSCFPNAFVFITNGFELKESLIFDLKKLALTKQIILCLDPDGPGEKIRKQLQNEIPNAGHVFAVRNKALSRNRKRVGIEHMKKEDILSMFSNIKIPAPSKAITYYQLYQRGYMDSKKKRQELCERLNIGYCNAKQLVKKLNMFAYQLEDLE